MRRIHMKLNSQMRIRSQLSLVADRAWASFPRVDSLPCLPCDSHFMEPEPGQLPKCGTYKEKLLLTALRSERRGSSEQAMDYCEECVDNGATDESQGPNGTKSYSTAIAPSITPPLVRDGLHALAD